MSEATENICTNVTDCDDLEEQLVRIQEMQKYFEQELKEENENLLKISNTKNKNK